MLRVEAAPGCSARPSLLLSYFPGAVENNLGEIDRGSLPQGGMNGTYN